MSDNNLYAVVWILVAGLLAVVLFKGCDADAMKEEAARNAAVECTRKGGTMYGAQCVICGAK